MVGCVTGQSAQWKTLPEVKKASYDETWSALVGIITAKNYNLETVDGNSGYLRSAWGNTGNNTATQVTARVISKKPLSISIKATMAQRDILSGQMVEVGNNTALENAITEELSARFK